MQRNAAQSCSQATLNVNRLQGQDYSHSVDALGLINIYNVVIISLLFVTKYIHTETNRCMMYWVCFEASKTSLSLTSIRAGEGDAQLVWVVADLWTAPVAADGPGKPVGKVVVVGFYVLDQVSVATAFVEVSGEGPYDRRQ